MYNFLIGPVWGELRLFLLLLNYLLALKASLHFRVFLYCTTDYKIGYENNYFRDREMSIIPRSLRTTRNEKNFKIGQFFIYFLNHI